MYWKSNYKSWLYSKFPEELYPCAPDKVDEYNEQVLAGLKIMGQSEVSICGLARNLAHILPLNIYRVEHLASLFGFAKIYIYENDSTDGTVDILREWKRKNPNVEFESETLGYGPLIQNRSSYRTRRMADARNKLLDMAKSDQTHFVIECDLDIKGGWSYEGLSSSFFWMKEFNADMMGSNSIIMQPIEGGLKQLQYDSWAYREWDLGAHADSEINELRFFRGEYPIKLHSCFGGLGLYKWESLMDLSYEYTYKDGPLQGQSDCEHCILHKKMRDINRNGIYLNPSMISLYDKYRF